MAKLTRKHEKNIAKLKSMVDGTYDRKISVGEHSVGRDDERHEVGDRWTDADGREWEQKQGFRSSVSKIKRGIADKCSDCEKYIFGNRDKKFFVSFARCYYCQLDFESKLLSYPLKHWAWRRLRAFKVWESIDKEALQYFDEI